VQYSVSAIDTEMRMCYFFEDQVCSSRESRNRTQ